jgi:hypothetical protein
MEQSTVDLKWKQISNFSNSEGTSPTNLNLGLSLVKFANFRFPDVFHA